MNWLGQRKAVLRYGLFVLVVSCCVSARAEWHTRTDAIMGTEIHVQLWHDNSAYAQNCLDLVIEEMHRVDALMSTYKPSSELSRVNMHGADRPVEVSDELFELIRRALELGRKTDGAFDITYASVGQFYDFRNRQKPSQQQKKNSLNAISLNHVVLNELVRSIRFSHAGVRIDLGGIAKGHAVESAVSMLKQKGVEHAIVTAGGDSRVLGDHRGRPWAVGIRDPRQEEALAARLPVQEEAISTSGDYERYFEAEGIRYHHIIEPTSGDSARSVRSVTIIGPDAVMTDALSTGVFVMGKDKGLQLIDSMESIEAVIIDANGKMYFSQGLKPGA